MGALDDYFADWQPDPPATSPGLPSAIDSYFAERDKALEAMRQRDLAMQAGLRSKNPRSTGGVALDPALIPSTGDAILQGVGQSLLDPLRAVGVAGSQMVGGVAGAGEAAARALGMEGLAQGFGRQADIQQAWQEDLQPPPQGGMAGAIHQGAFDVLSNLPQLGVVAAAGPVAGVGLLGAQSGGQEYHQALQDGATHGQALESGLISGGSEALFETVLGDVPALRRIVEASAGAVKTPAQALWYAAKTANGEGLEELFTQITQRLGQETTYKHSFIDAETVQRANPELSPEDASRIAENTNRRQVLDDIGQALYNYGIGAAMGLVPGLLAGNAAVQQERGRQIADFINSIIGDEPAPEAAPPVDSPVTPNDQAGIDAAVASLHGAPPIVEIGGTGKQPGVEVPQGVPPIVGIGGTGGQPGVGVQQGVEIGGTGKQPGVEVPQGVPPVTRAPQPIWVGVPSAPVETAPAASEAPNVTAAIDEILGAQGTAPEAPTLPAPPPEAQLPVEVAPQEQPTQQAPPTPPPSPKRTAPSAKMAPGPTIAPPPRIAPEDSPAPPPPEPIRVHFAASAGFPHPPQGGKIASGALAKWVGTLELTRDQQTGEITATDEAGRVLVGIDGNAIVAHSSSTDATKQRSAFLAAVKEQIKAHNQATKAKAVPPTVAAPAREAPKPASPRKAAKPVDTPEVAQARSSHAYAVKQQSKVIERLVNPKKLLRKERAALQKAWDAATQTRAAAEAVLGDEAVDPALSEERRALAKRILAARRAVDERVETAFSGLQEVMPKNRRRIREAVARVASLEREMRDLKRREKGKDPVDYSQRQPPKSPSARAAEDYYRGLEESAAEGRLAGADPAKTEADNPYQYTSENHSAAWVSGFRDGRNKAIEEGRIQREPGVDFEPPPEDAGTGSEAHIPFDAIPDSSRDLWAEPDKTGKMSKEVAALRREIAKLTHPDKARDDADRQRRTRFMSVANAVADGEERGRSKEQVLAQLREIIAAWHRGDADPPGYSSGPKQAPPGAGKQRPGPAYQEPPPPKPPPAEAPPPDEAQRQVNTEPVKLKLEMPEIVELLEKVAKALRLPQFARIVQEIRAGAGMKARGSFNPRTYQIELIAALFNDPAQAAKTFAHELGHFIDAIGGVAQTIGRGNILGSLASLKGYMKSMLDELPSEPSKVFTEAELKKWWSEARRRHPQDAEAAKADYHATMRRQMEARGLVDKKTVHDELWALSRYWRPVPDDASPAFLRYRKNPRELYADAFSALLNDPETVKRVAPTFHSLFFNYLSRKGPAKTVYEDLQARGALGRDAVNQAREERIAGDQGSFAEGVQQEANRVSRPAPSMAPQGIVREFMRNFVEKHDTLYKLQQSARKIGGKTFELAKAATHAVEEWATSNSANLAYWTHFEKNVIVPIAQANITSREAGYLGFLMRVQGDRAKIANPLGITPEIAAELEASLKKKLGKDFDRVKNGILEWKRNIRVHLIDDLIASGIPSPELAKQLRETNETYLRFDVLEHLAEGDQLLAEQIGTLKKIANPLLATVIHDMALRNYIDRTNAVRHTVAFLRSMGIGRDAEFTGTGRYRKLAGTEAPGFTALKWTHEGRPTAWEVPNDVAAAFKRDPGHFEVTSRFLKVVNNIFRKEFITYNPGWAIFNFWKDHREAFRVTPGFHPFKRARIYAQVSYETAKAFWNNDLTARELKMLDERGIYAPGQAVYDLKARHEDDVFAAIAYRVGATDQLHRNEIRKPLYRAVRRILHLLAASMRSPGEFTERAIKQYADQYLEETQPGMSAQERAAIVRNRIGAPGAYRGGASKALANNVFLFSNIATQGYRANWEALRDNPAEFVAKTVAFDMASAVAVAAAIRGALKFLPDDLQKELRAICEMIPDYDLANYTVIPIGWARDDKFEGVWKPGMPIDEKGRPLPHTKAVYLRIPHGHFGQFVHAMTWKIVKGLKATDIAQLYNQNFPYAAGQASPVFDAIRYPLVYGFTGKAPVDSFSGYPIMSETDAKARSAESWAKVARASWNELGGSLYRFDTTDTPKIQSEIEKILDPRIPGTSIPIPFAKNILGRLVRVSDRGYGETLREREDQFDQERARKLQKVIGFSNKYWQEHPDASPREVADALYEAKFDNPYETRAELIEQLRNREKRWTADIEQKVRDRSSRAKEKFVFGEEN